ncbi:E3 ubiquitin-protein ligase rad18 [Coniosporium apollinis]|uniref:Postreplication repair E3 ubiquitin-protein ligase RAD18 n=2 Tax=Coniosporium TaxID=2810619 RepID=A0ABQ9P4F5_9PEZI|nr:E3 ubiquitin-protein ligase rad18 [Cladosporium sp. JES 115]KAJ9669410.1 E3 ubiquitin-protein ligase rad18 [Coniosporium apollinis]
MDRRLDIADSTDWIGTPLAPFQSLENALRCQVCKDFYDTPMITSCSHTFCSLCIRKALTSDGKCPVCRASDQASKLRRNWAVQEIVDAFQAARPAALKIAQEHGSLKEGQEARRKKLKRSIQDTGPEDQEEELSFQFRRTRSQSRRAAAATSSQEVNDVVNGEEEYQPDDGLVPCPICNSRMKEEAVYAHLDRCDGQPSSQGRSTRSRASAATLKPPQRQPYPQQSKATTPPTERLPQLSYSLLKDNALRKKLQELGIASWGPRPLLIRRHTEWVNLYNSNCDSSRPRSKRELLAELETWERTQGGSAPNAGAAPAGVMRKEFDGQAWARSNHDHFEDLIAQARKKRTPTDATKEERTGDQESEKIQGSPDQDIDDEGKPAMINGGRNTTPNGETSGSRDNPYEGNEEALSIIRRKVEEANHGNTTQRSSTEDEDVPMANALLPSEQARAEEMQDSIEPLSAPSRKSPLSPTRKKPMFSVPEEPVEDYETDTQAH